MAYLTPSRSLLAGLLAAILLFPSYSKADVKYKLVTDESGLLPGCVYVLAAADADFVAAKQSPDGSFATVDVTRQDDTCISVADNSNILELLAVYFDDNKTVNGYHWGFSTGKRADPLLRVVGDRDQGYWMGLHDKINAANSQSEIEKYDNKNYTYVSKVAFDSQTSEVSIKYYPTRDKSLVFISKDNSYVLNPAVAGEEDTKGIRLYRKDLYDLRIINPKRVYAKDDVIKVHVNTFDSNNPNYKGYLFYLFTDDNSYLSVNEAYNLASKSGQTLKPDAYPSGVVEIVYPGGDKTLWVYREHFGSVDMNDILCVSLRESRGKTSAESGHFSHPKATGYTAGEVIEFARESDVKIYYTLDGLAPILPEASTTVAAVSPFALDGDSAEEEQPAGTTDEHAGHTYDLDARPLTFDGTTINLSYLAVKDGYEPSEIHTLQIKGTSTLLDLPVNDDDSHPVYHDLQGRRISAPTAPGIYLRTLSGKTEKFIIH